MVAIVARQCRADIVLQHLLDLLRPVLWWIRCCPSAAAVRNMLMPAIASTSACRGRT
jgi:hypothetical protein